MKSEDQNPRRVAIVAAGIVSPLGFGLTETLRSLQQARDCVTPVTAFSVEKTRCKTAAQIDDGRLLSNAIRTGRYHRILAGGYDALSELVFVGFDSLQAATPEKCRPFDSNRSGMVLGEGAALLALEEFESARRRGAEVLGEIIGYGISTDNHHLTQPNPDGSGPRRAMEQALAQAQLEPNQVGYINAHGTATVLNDTAEGKAIAELFGEVPVSSTKSMMGHSLGAAGAIEAVVSLLALQHQFLPPNINFREAELSLNIVANEARDAQFDCTISNSFGFGGTNATIVLRRFAR